MSTQLSGLASKYAASSEGRETGGAPNLKGHHIRQAAVAAVAISWAAIFYAFGVI